MPRMRVIVASLLLSAASARMIPRAASEDMVLADCGIGTMPDPTHSESRQVFYYAKGFKPGAKPDQATEVLWDGSYPWRNTGVDVRMPNGEVFNIVINPDIKDGSKDDAGLAQRKDVKYKCRGDHGKDASKLANGMQCTTAYICHRQAAAPKPKPAPKNRLRAQFTISTIETDIRVQGTTADEAKWNPKAAFAHIEEAIEKNQCTPESYPIGNDCTISFECTFGNPNNVQPFKNILKGAVTKAVEATKKTKTGHYRGTNCPPGREGCIPDDYEFKYLMYTYPQTGKVLVTVEPEGHPEHAAIQSELSWRTQCKASGICGAFCGTYGGLMVDWMSGAAGLPPIASIGCLAC
ncbi:hypothetical protein CFE70_007001 [Pyrenophora teres f. teres 0-1]|uniref:Uncharacterized protein n=2 Tax=Pyrenophora teres f. teres TaxID=97479 RepID=E3RUG6_PYRTT|nr:hypothetical protein PTT_12729 [Pyrenophora teres f. teres 0-1]KAE8822313.1 hypothetical protein HRS9139_10334 [Pyrenophora teres f. teres]KAE8835100.1 hypothetical protein PTNB85_06433 [Pyrenophora teres f. teres]KAE8843426.1 hypothetical protein HRS9122_04529 [Pyrenophora teres f. teres]KAE8861389.1 hypothetical protein PTNB29_06484 [Pyrenophora teres f. teres]